MAYLWTSKSVPQDDQQAGFGIAVQVLDQLSLPSTMPIQLVVQVGQVNAPMKASANVDFYLSSHIEYSKNCEGFRMLP